MTMYPWLMWREDLLPPQTLLPILKAKSLKKCQVFKWSMQTKIRAQIKLSPAKNRAKFRVSSKLQFILTQQETSLLKCHKEPLLSMENFLTRSLLRSEISIQTYLLKKGRKNRRISWLRAMLIESYQVTYGRKASHPLLCLKKSNLSWLLEKHKKEQRYWSNKKTKSQWREALKSVLLPLVFQWGIQTIQE